MSKLMNNLIELKANEALASMSSAFAANMAGRNYEKAASCAASMLAVTSSLVLLNSAGGCPSPEEVEALFRTYVEEEMSTLRRCSAAVYAALNCEEPVPSREDAEVARRLGISLDPCGADCVHPTHSHRK